MLDRIDELNRQIFELERQLLFERHDHNLTKKELKHGDECAEEQHKEIKKLRKINKKLRKSNQELLDILCRARAERRRGSGSQ